jgi:hypothetical protein
LSDFPAILPPKKAVSIALVSFQYFGTFFAVYNSNTLMFLWYVIIQEGKNEKVNCNLCNDFVVEYWLCNGGHLGNPRYAEWTLYKGI